METIEELKEHIKELEKEIEDKDFEIGSMQEEIDEWHDHECDVPDDTEIGDFDIGDIESAFKEHYNITNSLVDEQKFDLIMRNFSKVSLQDLEQFFQSKGLEIV